MSGVLGYILGVLTLALVYLWSERPRVARPSWRRYYEHCAGCTVVREIETDTTVVALDPATTAKEVA